MKALTSDITITGSKSARSRVTIALCVCLSFFLAVKEVSGQKRFSLEFRPSANFTVKSGDIGIGNGGGFEAVASYRVISDWSIYAGWGWNSFSSIYGSDTQATETGYTFGMQYIRPMKGSQIAMMLRGGGIYDHIEFIRSSQVLADSGHGLGWQLEGGTVISVGPRWSLVPGIRFRSWSKTMSTVTAEKIDLNYFSVGMGVKWQL